MKTTTYTNKEIYADGNYGVVIGWNKIKTTTEVVGFTRRPEAEIADAIATERNKNEMPNTSITTINWDCPGTFYKVWSKRPRAPSEDYEVLRHNQYFTYEEALVAAQFVYDQIGLQTCIQYGDDVLWTSGPFNRG